MAEEHGEKTEAPTPRRREEAREQGQVARSADLTAAVLLLGALLLMKAFGPGLIDALGAIMRELLSAESLAERSIESAGVAIRRGVLKAMGALSPLLGGVVMIAVVMNVAQVGLILTGKRLQPNFGAPNPIRGPGRNFKGEGAVKLVLNVLKLVLVAAVAWYAARDRMEQIVGAQQLDPLGGFGLGASIVFAVGIRIAVLLLVLALIDYAYQRLKHERELRMSRREVKEEMRRMEGDPKIKQRRRQIAIQMAQRRLKNDVPTADVVVTNPTHYAVALKYDAAAMNAPKVVAKGQGFMAARIREIAIESGVPILERKPLARALYKLVEVGQEIPERFYAAVAEILAYVYELTGKARERQLV